jgi:hypothetical protein
MADFTYTQKHCWVIGHLVVGKAYSKETAIPIPKTYLKAANDLVEREEVRKHGEKFYRK